MSLRILHISTRLILGGSQENTVLSCEGQARLGHDVHLAFGPIYGPEGSMLERVESFNGVQQAAGTQPIVTHEVTHMVRDVNPFSDRAALCELERLIAAIEPDIVHTHSSKAGILGRFAAWEHLRRHRGTGARRPGVVHTIHGPPFMPLEGGWMSRAKILATNALYAALERRAARRCHLVVCVADAMRTQFLDRGIGRPEQYVTVRSGMEIEPYVFPQAGEGREQVRARLGLREDDFVIGTVARLAQHKGHDDILDALAQTMRSRPQFKLLWVGDGWWADRLRRRIEALGLRDRVVLTGLVAPERIPGLVRAMDVLCHPSYREGLPRTVPQALLCGVCPVAYDVDGTGEICREMETGRLVAPGDVSGLGEALQWLADHPEERHALASRGRAECIEQFDARRMVSQLEEVYRHALDRV
ncbi:MAG: glycosyltransferase family 1 protein [Leptolyngbya sp. PLA3]|nr:MAG: glycosyltransferase family 1 protein [Cyanobacteria bacterium CYA]MCE7967371.1 glycosyltransferase family 1 protein [Leptolyngbya sp. PL-A3]